MKEKHWLQAEYYHLLDYVLQMIIQKFQCEGLDELIEIYLKPIEQFVTDEEAKNIWKQ